MKDLKQHTPALLVIVVLVIARFIVVPLLDWQDNTLAEQKLLERKVYKANQLLNHKEQLIEQQALVESAIAKLTPLFYRPEDIDAFKLAEQQKIEEQLNTQSLASKRIGWQTLYQLPGTTIRRLDLEYNFEGEGSQVLQYLLELERDQHLIQTPEFSLSFRGQREGQVGIISVFIRRSYYLLSESDRK